MEFVLTKEDKENRIDLSEIINQLEANDFDSYPLIESLKKGT